MAAALRHRLDPLAAGMLARDVRTEGLAASRGATDFGEYFTYFSFFLVMSALLVWRHKANIHKLVAGEEDRIGEKRDSASA